MDILVRQSRRVDIPVLEAGFAFTEVTVSRGSSFLRGEDVTGVRLRRCHERRKDR